MPLRLNLHVLISLVLNIYTWDPLDVIWVLNLSFVILCVKYADEGFFLGYNEIYDVQSTSIRVI